MRVIKVVLIALLSLAGLFIIISVLLPATYRVERSVNIKAPPAVVFSEINDFSHIQHWSPWNDYDPSMKTIIEGEIGVPGYKYSWESDNKKMGRGSLTRIKTENNRFIQNDLLFENYGMMSCENWKMEETSEGVKLYWINSGSIAFAFRLPMSLMSIEKMVAPDFEKGLNRIKKYCESLPIPLPDTLQGPE